MISSMDLSKTKLEYGILVYDLFLEMCCITKSIAF